MKFFYCDHYEFPLPADHRFPVRKYALLRRRIQRAGFAPPADLIESPPATDKQILRVHQAAYLRKLRDCTLTDREERRLGLPWSPALLERSRRSVGGTIAACRAALAEGVAMNLAGGTHHAYPGHGEGFCVLNDCAIAARAMQAERRAARVVILDCDVHQGNGTAAIFAGDPNVFTFSIHAANNFPLHKEKSDLDVELPDGAGDQAYLEELDWGVQRSLHLCGASLALYLAGADPHEGDALGRLAVSKPGLAARDRLVLGHCRAAGVPVAVVMGGGYGRRIDDSVDVHFQTAAAAVEAAQNWRSSPGAPLAQ